MSGDKISAGASVTTWAGAFMSGAGALSVTDWLAAGGFCLALAGFIVNFWHKRSIIKIERERLDRQFPRSIK